MSLQAKDWYWMRSSHPFIRMVTLSEYSPPLAKHLYQEPIPMVMDDFGFLVPTPIQAKTVKSIYG